MEKVSFFAQTYAEFAQCKEKPSNIAWMACHFSPYGTGLSNIPRELPAGSMLIINDRIPICGHDPDIITKQLCAAVADLNCSKVLLDFQRPNSELTCRVVRSIIGTLSCPVGVSDLYAQGLDCPVFLPPPGLNVLLDDHLAAWDDREIWLEAALDMARYTISKKGCVSLSLPYSPPDGNVLRDEKLCCSYQCETREDAAVFTLWRTPEDLAALLDQATSTQVSQTIGLYQQFCI